MGPDTCRATIALAVAAALLTGCGGPADDANLGGGAGADEVEVGGSGAGGLVACDELSTVAAPEERYADEPVYVANEMPVEQVGAWAAQQPGFEELWIDRDRNGWITVGFSQDAQARQAEIEERFPGEGVVAVELEHTAEELEALQRRVVEELSFDVGSDRGVPRGAVSIDMGSMTDERLEEIAGRFGDEPVCISGTDPAQAPPEGPQQTDGDGWRLLAVEQDAGQSYHTAIATDEDQYVQLWRDIGLGAERPEVDLDAHVVIHFGAVYGSGCENLRLDDVVVDASDALVHADIVLPDAPPACAADANPYAFVVAVPRDRLPRGPFALQLGAGDPPPGAPGERTYVEVDLSAPGAVAASDDVRTATPEDLGVTEGAGHLVEPGGVIEPGFEAHMEFYVHCGAQWLGEINGQVWRTDEVADDPGNVPPAWSEVATDEVLEVELLLETGSPPTLTATANDHSIDYKPTNQPQPGCD